MPTESEINWDYYIVLAQTTGTGGWRTNQPMRTRTPLNSAQVVIACKCDKGSMMTIRPKVQRDGINFCRVFCGIKKPA